MTFSQNVAQEMKRREEEEGRYAWGGEKGSSGSTRHSLLANCRKAGALRAGEKERAECRGWRGVVVVEKREVERKEGGVEWRVVFIGRSR